MTGGIGRIDGGLTDAMTGHRHCEERSDEAIQSRGVLPLDYFASLAMTGGIVIARARPEAIQGEGDA
ncbi:MAG: hypothetical protein LBT00_03935, partial [Spirochaetaceae bacterium]|nr:hypothetical protein [Spirochaetaceae bacterium]